ncbi:unnamed protein product [Effrenium voratum]|nr:unnamed protein product [Effrenium voratum]
MRRRQDGQKDKPPLVLDRAISSSVPLQIILYVGVWFDLAFAVIEVLAGWAKIRWINGTIIMAVICANYVLCFLLEPCRLYLGYVGNLGEKVPELFLFVFLCMGCMAIIIADLVLCFYVEDLQPGICSLAPEYPCVLPVEQVFWVWRLALLLLELILGIRALRRLIHEQSARFFVALDTAEGTPFDDLSSTWAERSRPGMGQERQSDLARVYGRPSSPQTPRRPHAD